MRKEHLAIGGIVVGVFLFVCVIAYVAWPRQEMEPPEVLQEQIISGDSDEEKIAAAQKLIKHGRKARPQVRKTIESVQQQIAKVEKPKDTQVRLVAPLMQAAVSSGDWQSIPRLFDLMEHPDPRIRGRAGAAAQELLGADYYWRANDPPDKRKRLLNLMRDQYERMQGDLREHYDN
jgi:hypothetical protein